MEIPVLQHVNSYRAGPVSSEPTPAAVCAVAGVDAVQGVDYRRSAGSPAPPVGERSAFVPPLQPPVPVLLPWHTALRLLWTPLHPL